MLGTPISDLKGKLNLIMGWHIWKLLGKLILQIYQKTLALEG